MAGEKITPEEEKTTSIAEKSVNNVETQNNPDIQAIKNETIVELSETKKDVLAPVQENINDKLTETEENSDDKLDDIANPLDIHNKNIQALKDLKKDIKETKKQLNTIARWTHATAICEQAKVYRDGLKDSINIINKNIRYERKLKNGAFTKDVRDIEDTKLMVVKIKAWIATTDKYSSFTLQGHNPAANKGIDKKDMYNGVERTRDCTPAEAEAAFAKCQGGGSLAKQERCKFVEEKTGIRQNLDKFLTPAGSNVATGAVKAIPTIIQIRGGWKAVKAGFGLLFGKKEEASKNRKNLAIGGAMFGAVTFLDPKKSYDTLSNTFGDWFGKAKGISGGNSDYITTKEIKNNIMEGGVSTEKIRDEYAPQLVAKALAGMTMGEVHTLGIIEYDNSEKPVKINFDILKGYYRKKMAGEGNRKDIYAELLRDVKYLEDVIKAKPKNNIIEHGFDGVGLGKDAFSAPESKDTLVGSYVAGTLQSIGIQVEYFEKLGLEDKIFQNKEIKDYITVYGVDKFMKQIMELPKDMRDKIYAGEIVLYMKDNKINLLSHNTDTVPGTQTLIDINTQKLSVTTPDGQSHEFMSPMTSLAEAIRSANKTNEIIQMHHGQYFDNEPFFFSDHLGSFFNDISVSQGERKRSNPMTRMFGKNQTVVNGWFNGVPSQASTFKKNMNKFAPFLNSLNIWKSNQADVFVSTIVLPQMKIKYPGLSEAEYKDLINGYMGLYRLRGDITGIMKLNAQEFGQGISNTANNIKDFTLQKSSELGARLGAGGKRVYEKGGLIFQSIDGKRIDMQNWISQSRNKKDQIWKDICAKAGVKREDVKNLTFEQLPEHIGYAIRFTFMNILRFTGNIVEGLTGKIGKSPGPNHVPANVPPNK